MSWLVWESDSEEIREENGIADVVVGYAKTPKEARQFANELNMAISITEYWNQEGKS